MGPWKFKTLFLQVMVPFQGNFFLNISCGSPHKSCLYEFWNFISLKKKRLFFFVNMGVKITKPLLQLWLFSNQTFSEVSLWQSLQKLLIGMLKNCFKRLKFNTVGIGENFITLLPQLLFFSNQTFANVPCGRPHKSYLFVFWNFKVSFLKKKKK